MLPHPTDCSPRLALQTRVYGICQPYQTFVFRVLFHPLLKNRGGAEEMALQLRALVTLAEDLCSVPSTHRWLTICNSSSKESDVVLFWPPQEAEHTYMHAEKALAYIIFKINKSLFVCFQFWFFETGLLCVSLAVLELAL